MRLKFFEMLYGNSIGYLCLATTDPRAPKATFIQRFFEWPKESLKAENWILKVEDDHNVYFCVNLLEKQERKKENCLPGNLLWADLDAVNPDTIQPPQIPPPIVIQSSPGRWQALWRITGEIDPYIAEDYSRRIAYSLAPFGADISGWDLTQLLRVPLTTNFKYNPPALIELDKTLETVAKPVLFETLPAFGHLPSVKITMPDTGYADAKSIIYKYKSLLDSGFISDYTYEPDQDWSQVIWRLCHRCYRAGMDATEVFIVASEAACNKYQRDGRPMEHLWRDVLRAGEAYRFVEDDSEFVFMPTLVESQHSKTFLDTYREWAGEATDAVSDFHDISMLIVLSAIVSTSVRIESSGPPMTPNLWGLILGESTLTRKSTAMRLALGFLYELDRSVLVANDGTSEGILQGVSERPNLPSIFHKDEVSGLFDSMARKDYMAGMQETLTALYDGQEVVTRRLRKETITIENPSFIFLAGGTPNRVHASTNDSFILSGFLPRFIVVAGHADMETYRPLGPPVEGSESKRNAIRDFLADLYEDYACEIQQRINGVVMKVPARYTAKLTKEAWQTTAQFERELLTAAYNSPAKSLALPTLDRLHKSMVKIGTIFAALRQRPGEFASSSPSIIVDEGDILNAAWYVQRWGQNSIDLIVNAGKSAEERDIDRVYEHIKETPGVLQGHLLRKFHLTARTGNLIIQTLEARGMIRKEQQGRGFAYWIT